MPTDLLHAIAELCCALESVSSPTMAREHLRAAAEVFGASFFLFGMRSGTTIVPPQQLIVSNYPKRWQRCYDDLNAFAFDPILNTALQFKGPFRWDGLHKSAPQLGLRQESVRSGMGFGITTSDRGPDAGVALLSFCGHQPIATGTGEWERAASALSLLASTTHKAFARVLRARYDSGESLRDVERRCLQLLAAARTAEEAAVELGVATRTVRYYQDQAAKKLGVATRKEAVVAAVAQGLIDIRKFPPLRFSSAAVAD